MRMKVDIQEPYPPDLKLSYEPSGYGNFGWCAWVYNGYAGAIEWINLPHFITEPKYPDRTAFYYYLHPGLNAVITPEITVRGDTADMVLNSVMINPVTGKGFPLVVP